MQLADGSGRVWRRIDARNLAVMALIEAGHRRVAFGASDPRRGLRVEHRDPAAAFGDRRIVASIPPRQNPEK
jgi:hypothetical protein